MDLLIIIGLYTLAFAVAAYTGYRLATRARDRHRL
jgi:hypothetical protein